MTTKRPTILIVNDDGISAPGILNLVEAMRPLGEIVVVAPDSPQSGMGHAITIAEPLRLERIHLFGEGVVSYQASGTPADCVKLAVSSVMHKRPDLVVSGINHGSNASINVIYSGTMSAAVEAAVEGIPAIGFSLLDYSLEADFNAAAHFAQFIAKQILKDGLPEGVLLNVNIPKLPLEEIKGIKICRQAKAKYEEKYDERIDPYQRKYYWLVGKFLSNDLGEDTDIFALNNGYVSIVPTQFDLTAHHAMSHLNNRDWNVENK